MGRKASAMTAVERQKLRYDRYKREGWCVNCGQAAYPGRVRCQACLDKTARQRQAARGDAVTGWREGMGTGRWTRSMPPRLAERAEMLIAQGMPDDAIARDLECSDALVARVRQRLDLEAA